MKNFWNSNFSEYLGVAFAICALALLVRSCA